MVHLYWGEGKGKTTAAMGVAMRSLAAGKQVTILQLLKSTPSGEVELLESLGAHVYRGKPFDKFVFAMNDEEKQVTRAMQEKLLQEAAGDVGDLFIIDEACGAVTAGMVDDVLMHSIVESLAERCELILTGRGPQPWMHELADYDTEMHCHKHPFDQGLKARRGIEF